MRLFKVLACPQHPCHSPCSEHCPPHQPFHGIASQNLLRLFQPAPAESGAANLAEQGGTMSCTAQYCRARRVSAQTWLPEAVPKRGVGMEAHAGHEALVQPPGQLEQTGRPCSRAGGRSKGKGRGAHGQARQLGRRGSDLH